MLVSNMAYVNDVAKSYGDALFMLAEELSQTEQIKEELNLVCKTLEENPDYLKLLDTPALSPDERLDLVEKVFGNFNRNLVSLIKILTEKRLAYLIHKIQNSYLIAYDISRNIERVEAVSAVSLTQDQKDKLVSKLEKITGKQIIVNNTIDPSILGGMKLRYMGKQIDGSIKTRLDHFEKSLKDLVI